MPNEAKVQYILKTHKDGENLIMNQSTQKLGKKLIFSFDTNSFNRLFN